MSSIGSVMGVSGFVTNEKFLRGHNLRELEKRLGYHKGRLNEGAIFVLLTRYPALHEFELRGYSQVAGHRYHKEYGQMKLDPTKLKQTVIKYWQEKSTQLVKIYPNIRHNVALSSDIQYPPGSGIPQWEIIKKNSRKGSLYIQSGGL